MSHNDDKEGALSGDQMHYDNDAEEYKNIAVTDPDYRDKNEKLVRANIVFSLPDGDWSEEHGKYYKFAAKIFKVA
ncbi:unknown [Clostridium sp. CAG:967]|nr:unknown [Clostridium sp. CAG:967]